MGQPDATFRIDPATPADVPLILARPGLYLEDLYVRPAHRGNGYGRRLLVHLARIAVDRDCGRFEWSVLDWNELAQATYRRAGAVPMDEWTVWHVTKEPL